MSQVRAVVQHARGGEVALSLLAECCQRKGSSAREALGGCWDRGAPRADVSVIHLQVTLKEWQGLECLGRGAEGSDQRAGVVEAWH